MSNARSSSDAARRAATYRAVRPFGRVLMLGAGVLAVAALTSPAAAEWQPYQWQPKPRTAHKQALHKQAQAPRKEPFGDIPKGPLQIVVSIDQQKLHLYSDGTEVATAPVATGVPKLPTPTGVFSVIQKQRYHESNIYSGAPMPFMQRITWSGVALHEGEGVGHPASHGCIRMPGEFAARLWELTRLGARVLVARPELKPEDFADPHLFVHRQPPAPAAPPPSAAADGIKTAQTTDPNKSSDAINADPANSKAAAASPPSATVGDGIKTAQTIDPAKSSDAIIADPANSKAATPIAVSGMVAPAATAQSATTDGLIELRGSVTETAPIDSPEELVPQPEPLPPAKPAAPIATDDHASHAPISIFISRKESRLYVRQNFAPLFDAPVTIADPQQPFGTLVFTALGYESDGATLHWNVVAFPGEPPKETRSVVDERRLDKRERKRMRAEAAAPADPAPPESPAAALARVAIPQDVIDQISALIVPGSSLVIADQGLGQETGEGTDFIVVTR